MNEYIEELKRLRDAVVRIADREEEIVLKLRDLVKELNYVLAPDAQRDHDCKLDRHGTGHCDHPSHKVPY